MPSRDGMNDLASLGLPSSLFHALSFGEVGCGGRTWRPPSSEEWLRGLWTSGGAGQHSTGGSGQVHRPRREQAEAAAEQINRCATRGRDQAEMPRHGLRERSFIPL